MIYSIELDNKKWTKARIYSCRECDGPETKITRIFTYQIVGK